MRLSCRDCTLRKCAAFVPMTDEELAFMERFKTGELTVDRGMTILLEGAASPQVFTVLSGLGLRYKTMQDGRRQVINLIMPGDFIGLQAGLMGEMGHSVEASTAMVLCVFDRAGLWTLFQTSPARAYDLTWLAAVEEHFLGEAIATVGQRDAMSALAWAFVRLFRRGKSLGLVKGQKMALPYRQQDLADSTGLSLVHTNKTLKRFREAGFMDWSGGILHMRDEAALARLAQLGDEELPRRPIL